MRRVWRAAYLYDARAPKAAAAAIEAAERVGAPSSRNRSSPPFERDQRRGGGREARRRGVIKAGTAYFVGAESGVRLASMSVLKRWRRQAKTVSSRPIATGQSMVSPAWASAAYARAVIGAAALLRIGTARNALAPAHRRHLISSSMW